MSDQNNKINKKVEIDLAELLKKDAPYLAEDGKVNLEKLKGLLTGKITEKEDDRFYFNWAGKDKVFQAIQAPAYSTLAPQKDKSIGWDETENLMIVGENLETLKLLLKPYFGKVKVIYIDPPYNTGKDFIYKDDFSAPLKDYLERTGQKGTDGTKLTTNSETNGRYHSDWLNFMYPRLFMARNLLKEDGVIFVSIDDNEVHHLRMMMNDIFGEDNFRNAFTVKRYDKNLNRQFIENGLKSFNVGFEYILCYAKSDLFKFNPIYRASSEKRTNFGYWKGFWNGADRPTMRYDILGFNPKKGQWKWSKDRAYKALSNYSTYLEQFSKEMSIEEYWIKTGKKMEFIRRNDTGKGQNMGVEHWIAPSTGVLRNTNWTDLFASKDEEEIRGIFDFPKSVEVIKNLIDGSHEDGDIILDFFAGSGTTAHAICEINVKSEEDKKFILVQLDEMVDENTESGKNAKAMGLNTVADICIHRLHALVKKYPKLNFKVFRLGETNFNLKEEFELTENKDLGELKTNYLKELGLYVDQPTIATANTLDIVYEIILKNGFSLNSKIEELKLGSNNFYKVSDAENELEIHISLDAKIEDGSVEAIRTTEYKGKTFAFYDNALTDSQKINLNTFVKLQVI